MIYIHIGPHKTGSTSIQGFMVAHEGALAAHAVHYPEVGRTRGGGHYGLKAEIRDRRSSPDGWGEVAALDKVFPGSKTVLSCEGFEYLNPKQIGRIAECLKGRQVTVVGYFREYAGLIQSQYLQLSRICRNVDDFDPFFERYVAENERLFLRFEHWADAFGWANVQVRHFDRAHLVGGDVVEDFIHTLGLSLAQLKVKFASERNLAPPWQAVEMTRAVFREFGRVGGAEDEGWMDSMRKEVRVACEAAVAVSASGSQKVNYLSAAQRQRCNAMTEQDIDDFNRRLPSPGLPRLGLGDAGERPFLPSVAQVAPADVALAMAQVTLALLKSAGHDKRDQKVRRKQERAGADADTVAALSAAAMAQRERKRKKVARSIAQASSGH